MRNLWRRLTLGPRHYHPSDRILCSSLQRTCLNYCTFDCRQSTTVDVLCTTVSEHHGWDLMINFLWMAVRLWKASRYAVLRTVFTETTHSDAYWNSWRTCAFSWLRFFRISIDKILRSLSLSFVVLLTLHICLQSSNTYHLLIAYATIDFG